MYKRICCPIDGSDTAARGLAEAIRLSSDQKAKLCLVHVVDQGAVTAYAPLVQDLLMENRQAGYSMLEAACSLAKEKGVDVEKKLIEIFFGGVGPAIAEAAQTLHADLIVMGTHGRRALGRLIMGSDATAVIGSANVPILLVK